MPSRKKPEATAMVKRSQWRFLKVTRYHTRLFALHDQYIAYYDNENKRSREQEKRRIEFKNVKGVEHVDSDALDGRKHAFQIIYKESGDNDQTKYLHVIAQSAEDREDWVKSIVAACSKEDVTFLKMYHPGIWNTKRGRWSCCQCTTQQHDGCQSCTNQTTRVSAGSSTGPNVDDKQTVTAAESDHSETPVDGSDHAEELADESDHAKKPADGSNPTTDPIDGSDHAKQHVDESDHAEKSDAGSDQTEEPKDGGIDADKDDLAEISGNNTINQDDQRYSRRVVVALYSYGAEDELELNLTKGKVYDVIDDSEKAWMKVKNDVREIGYIPSNYVTELSGDQLERYGWYYKGITRRQCDAILKKEQKEGCFMVYDSAARDADYAVALFTKEIEGGFVRHYLLKTFSGKFGFSASKTKDTIPELISYHHQNSGDTLAVRLSSAPSDRPENLPAVGLGYDRFELDPVDIELQEEIGKGEFGVVCKAIFKKKRVVAVKQMKEGVLEEDKFIEEARTQLHYQHRHIVQLYGVVSKKKPLMIVLEYMKNGSLQQYLKSNFKDSISENEETLLGMCLDICDAMKYLESQKCIHRDLAARNCLVGEGNIVKVSDFGLARFVTDGEYVSSAGTKFPLKWASPEVLKNNFYSSKSDVWAFGVTMWEIWTAGNQTLYGHMRRPEIVARVGLHKYNLPKPDDCPPDVFEIMKECWQFEHEGRPSFDVLHKRLSSLQRSYNRKYGKDGYNN